MAGYIGNKAVGLNVTTGDILGDVGVGGVVTANAGVVVDNFTLDGTTLALSSGDFTLDVAGDIILDADGAQLRFRDGGTEIGVISNSSNDLQIVSSVSDADMIFRGNDGGTPFNALTLDMSDAGSAIFNQKVIANSSSSGDYVRMYAGSGTGKWDIYGNGANLRFSDNESAGSVVFDRQINASAGIAIGGTGAANKLDDYEEGTFTPAYAASGTAFGAIAHNTQAGNYTKVGNLVTISIALRTGSYTAGSTSGNVTITGLPFTAGGIDTYPIAINAQDAWTNFMPYQGWVANTTVTLTNNSGGSDRTLYRQVPVANMTTGANKNRIYLVGTYTTAS